MDNGKTLENLKKLIGANFEDSDVIGAFVGENEPIEIEETQYKSNFDGYGECTRYDCYEDVEDSMIFELWVSDDGTIVEVDTFQY